MTINSTTRKAGPFIGNGTTTAFPFAYKVFQASDLLVVRLDTTLNIEQELTLNTDYTVTLNLDQDSNPGGTVNLLAALATGYTLTLTSDLANLQPTDLTNQGGFYPDVINDALDRATIQIQQLQEQTDRSLKVAVSSTADATLPPPSANDLIGWNSEGDGLVNVDPESIGTVVAYATAYCDVFVGNGITTSWTLSRNPAVLYNLDVSINGSTQEPTRDYTLSGTTFTMTTPPPIGSRVVVKYKEGLPNYDGDSQDVRFVAAGSGAVPRTSQAKMRDIVSVTDFGAIGDGNKSAGTGTDNLAAIQNAYNYCRANGKSLYIPAGSYRMVGQVNWATGSLDATTGLYECNNVTVFGDGRDTVLWTDYPGGTGADVLQLNLLQNITFRDLAVTSRITSNLNAGSNGISITGGFDNVNLYDVYPFDLPYVETTVFQGLSSAVTVGNTYTTNSSSYYISYYDGAGTAYAVRTSGTTIPTATGTLTGTPTVTYTNVQAYPDGGKGVSFQTGNTGAKIGSSVVRAKVKNSAEGVGFDVSSDGWQSGNPQVRIEAVVEDCYMGFKYSGDGLASPSLDDGFTAGIVANMTISNCQRSVLVSRGYGMDINAMVVNTKSAANLRLNAGFNTVSAYWLQFDQIVDGFFGAFIKNSNVQMTGYLSEVDYKITIGDTLESSGGTFNCRLFFNLGGPAATVKNVNVRNIGGNNVQNCEIVFSKETTAYSSDLDLLFSPASNNTVTINQQNRFVNPKVQGKIGFAYNDGVTVYNELERDGLTMFFKQTGGSGADLQTVGVKNHLGTKTFAVRQEGTLATAYLATATAVATVKGVYPLYDLAGNTIGYIPVYTTYTP